MGRITVFMRDNCPFCDRAQALIATTVPQVIEKANNADRELEPLAKRPPKPVLEVLVLNVGRDAALAAQCIRLSNSRTVPQIFVNERYFGNYHKLKQLHEAGMFEQALLKACRKTTQFPPEPEAAMVKLTNDVAFSSLPTAAQIRGLHAFGFRGVINLCHPSETTEVRLKQEASIAEAAGLAYSHIPPPCLGATKDSDTPLPCGSQLPCSGDTGAKATDTKAATTPADDSGEGGGDDSGSGEAGGDDGGSGGAGAGAGAGAGSHAHHRVQHTDAGTEAVRQFQYTRRWMRGAVCALYRSPKPVLVHCFSGAASCAVSLLRAAVEMGAKVSQVERWANDLGHNLADDEQLFAVLGHELDVAAAAAATSTTPSARAPCISRFCDSIAEADEGEADEGEADEGGDADGDAESCVRR